MNENGKHKLSWNLHVCTCVWVYTGVEHSGHACTCTYMYMCNYCVCAIDTVHLNHFIRCVHENNHICTCTYTYTLDGNRRLTESHCNMNICMYM